jgi:26S proteasome subunit RPN7
MVFQFDVDSITQRYTGEAALQRFIFVGRHDPSLAFSAFQAALEICRQRKNVICYKHIYATQADLLSLGIPPLDAKWVHESEAQNRKEFEVLQGKLATSQAHLNKDAIRTAYTDLSDFMARTGDLTDALTYVLRAKDYCSTRQQQASNSHRILSLAVHQRNYAAIRDLVSRVDYTGMKTVTTVLASALERLHDGDMVKAAEKFREVAFGEVPSSSHPDAGNADLLLEFLSPEDIALFAGVTNLAADRMVAINLAEHSAALEPAPILRKVLVQFHKTSDHREACKNLEEHVWPALKYDIFFNQSDTLIQPLQSLQQDIRAKAIGQYWKPYNNCSLQRMAEALGPSIAGTPTEFKATVLSLLFDKKRAVLPRDTRFDSRTDTLVRDMEDDDILAVTTAKLQGASMQVLDDAYCLLVRLACDEHNIHVGDAKRSRYGYPAAMASHRVEMSDDEHDDAHMADTPMEEIDAMNPEDLY